MNKVLIIDDDRELCALSLLQLKEKEYQLGEKGFRSR
ncbi:hypothetical protein C823_006761 [Eubacterium plexicaudatum ASF492]|uniref:Uncharacterized protein n=1 Tax=Eubacterium plexicaudatum ASF492 TaxID=1235802 RepID=N2A6K1_9FIRM|nr:hypothetical protein C823_006761 [Eubacterium plexicaudatum ASF492]